MIFNSKLDYNETQEANEFSFYSSEIPIEYLNSLRRFIMSDYKKYSFDGVKVKKNTGVLNDEIMKNRIEMIPIKCSKELQFSINVYNKDKEFLKVYSDEIVCDTDDKDYFFDKHILLNKLRKGEQLEMTFKTTKNSPVEHVKHRIVNVIILKKIRMLKLKEKNEDVVRFLKNQYDVEVDNDYGLLDKMKTNLDIKRIVQEKFNKDLVDIEYYKKNDKFVYFFSIESDYYNPEEIFYSAVDMLKARLNNMVYSVKRSEMGKKYYLNFVNENMTLMNILQHELNDMEEVYYSYYFRLYPLDKDIELQIFLNESQSFEMVLKKGIEKTIEFLNKLNK